MALTITTRTDESGAVVQLAGEVDLATVEDMNSAVSAVLGEPSVVTVIVDLTALTFLDSTGINALIKLRRSADTAGIALTVDQATGGVRRVLEVTGVWQHLSGATAT